MIQIRERGAREYAPWFVLGAVALVALVWPLFAGDQVADFAGALRAPGDGTLLGTDHSGYDLGVRTAEGLRISLIIAALCAVISTVIGLAIGIGSVTIGGWFDAVVMRVVDGVNALPHLVVGVLEEQGDGERADRGGDCGGLAHPPQQRHHREDTEIVAVARRRQRQREQPGVDHGLPELGVMIGISGHITLAEG